MKKALSILGGIVCFLVCIVLFAFQISFMVISPIKTLITKDSMRELINNVNVREIISESPKEASDIYGAFDSLGFNVEETNEILESNSFKEFVNDYIYGNINSILDNEDVSLEVSDIKNLISNIEEERNISFENKEDFLKLVEEKYPDIKESINFSNNINQNVDEETLGYIKILTSTTLVIVFIVLFIFIYLIMCVLRWSVYKPLVWYGITTIISSFLMFQVFLSVSLLDLIQDRKLEKLKPIIGSALNTFRNKGMIISGIMLLIGIIMVIAFYFINKKVKSNDSNNIETKLENL